MKIQPPDGPWRLVCPADNPKSAREYEGASPFQAALQVATGTGSKYTWDEKAGKLYVKASSAEPKPAAKPKPNHNLAGAVAYPSGSVAERHSENNHPDYAPAHPSIATALVKVEPDIQVSKHFRLSEFRPKSSRYNGVRVHPELVELLEEIRSAAGCPIRITSAYRPPAYNRSGGGASSSFHMDGVAADIYSDNHTTAQLHAICSRVLGNFGGLGYYPSQGFCHVDVGPYARWQG